MKRQMDRRGQVDRLIDGDKEGEERREEEHLGFLRTAPLRDLFFPPQRNKSSETQAIAILVHPPSSWFDRNVEKKAGRK